MARCRNWLLSRADAPAASVPAAFPDVLDRSAAAPRVVQLARDALRSISCAVISCRDRVASSLRERRNACSRLHGARFSFCRSRLASPAHRYVRVRGIRAPD